MTMQARKSSANYERTLTDQQFSILTKLAHDKAGLMISESKRQMIESRLVRHLRSIECHDVNEYFSSFQHDASGEAENALISVLTTNVSSFFRENHHFETVEKDVLPLLRTKVCNKGKVRIWSAGCSTGQEPYSIAMLLLDRAPELANADLRILGTDIDRTVLARAKSGIYRNDEVSTIPSKFRSRFLAGRSGEFRVTEDVRRLVSFRPLNLIDEWPMKGRFDIIFCRNVVIYFSSATQLQLWPRFHAALEPNGYFFLGHSERISDAVNAGYTARGVTTYSKSETKIAKLR